MKVSIITATHNSLKSLPTALESISTQTYNDIEWIIVDNNSTDGTQKYIKDQKTIIDNFISEPDRGIYDALNKGIDIATGDIIGFLHSDDMFYSENIISHIADAFNTYKVDGIYGDLQYVSKNKLNKIVRFWKSNPFKMELLKQGWMPPHPSIFLRKEVYQNYGDFDLSFNISSDYDFILRIFQQPELKFHYLNETFTKMRLGGKSNKSLKNIFNKSREDLMALKKNKIPDPYVALCKKNLSKIPQFIKRAKP